MKTILFIDGENFIKKIKSAFESEKKDMPELHEYDFKGLFEKVLNGIKIDRKISYFARILEHKESLKKSKKLIQKQRLLKKRLENQGFEFLFAGRVRGNKAKCPKGHEFLLFKEKGVDVRIAVDMLAMAYNKQLKTAILTSSDSDLQPVIKELRKINIEIIYLGFELEPNKGLTYTTNRTILIRNSELMQF